MVCGSLVDPKACLGHSRLAGPVARLFWKPSRLIVAGTVRRAPSREIVDTRALHWALPVLTKIVVRSFEMNGGFEHGCASDVPYDHEFADGNVNASTS